VSLRNADGQVDRGHISVSASAICTKPLARQLQWPLDGVLDTEGGVHDSPTPAYAGRFPAAQLLAPHDSVVYQDSC
jgi:hypothetical protein